MKSHRAAAIPPEHGTPLKENKYDNFPFARGDMLDPVVKEVIEKIRTARFGSKPPGSLDLVYESAGVLEGIGFESLTHWKAPDQLRIDSKSGISVIYSRGSAFVVYGPVVLDVVNEEVERLKTEVWTRHLSLSLQFDDPALEVEMWGESEFQNRKAVKLRIWSGDLQRYALFYFDRESFILLGMEYSAKINGRDVDFIETFSDYRIEKGINLPHERRVRLIGESLIGRTHLVEKISSFSFVPAGVVFTKPQQAKSGSFYLREIPGLKVASILFRWRKDNSGDEPGSKFDELLAWLDRNGMKPSRVPVATNRLTLTARHSVHPLTFYFSPYSSFTVRFNSAGGDGVEEEVLETLVAIEAAGSEMPPGGDHAIVLKDAGPTTYACMFHKGSPRDALEGAARLKDWAFSQGFEIAGDMELVIFDGDIYKYKGIEKGIESLSEIRFPLKRR